MPALPAGPSDDAAALRNIHRKVRLIRGIFKWGRPVAVFSQFLSPASLRESVRSYAGDLRGWIGRQAEAMAFDYCRD